MAEAPLINGRRYQYSSIEMSLLRPDGKSEIFIDMDEISYSDALDIAFVPGTAESPVGWTAGTYNAEDTVTQLMKSSFQQGIVDAIGDGWMGANVEIVVKYNDEGEPLVTDKIVCRIMKAEDSHSFGPDPLKVKVSYKTMYILRNGKKPIKNLLV